MLQFFCNKDTILNAIRELIVASMLIVDWSYMKRLKVQVELHKITFDGRFPSVWKVILHNCHQGHKIHKKYNVIGDKIYELNYQWIAAPFLFKFHTFSVNCTNDMICTNAILSSLSLLWVYTWSMHKTSISCVIYTKPNNPYKFIEEII